MSIKQEELPKSFLGRRIILDIRCIDEKGNIYDIEMQASRLSGKVSDRIQLYDFRLIDSQVLSGDDLEELIPVYVIVFIDDIRPKKCKFVDRYMICNDSGVKLINNQVDTSYIYLKSISEIVENKGIENLDEFESMCYVLAFNPDDDILKLEKESVRIMMRKYEQMLANDQILTYAQQANRLEYEHKHEVKEMREIGIQQGKQEAQKNIVRTLLLTKYGIVDEEWIDSLKEDQIDTVIKACLTTNTLDELKQIVDNN